MINSKACGLSQPVVDANDLVVSVSRDPMGCHHGNGLASTHTYIVYTIYVVGLVQVMLKTYQSPSSALSRPNPPGRRGWHGSRAQSQQTGTWSLLSSCPSHNLLARIGTGSACGVSRSSSPSPPMLSTSAGGSPERQYLT